MIIFAKKRTHVRLNIQVPIRVENNWNAGMCGMKYITKTDAYRQLSDIVNVFVCTVSTTKSISSISIISLYVFMRVLLSLRWYSIRNHYEHWKEIKFNEVWIPPRKKRCCQQLYILDYDDIGIFIKTIWGCGMLIISFSNSRILGMRNGITRMIIWY